MVVDDMIVDSGGTSDRAGGMPPGYRVSASSGDSVAVEEAYGERWSRAAASWTR